MTSLLPRKQRVRRGSRGAAIAAVAVASTLALGGCAGTASAGADGSSAGTTTVTFALDYLPSPSHVGLAWAMEHGLFTKEGLDVKVLPYGATGSDTLISTGRADMGFFGSMIGAIYAQASGAAEKPVFMASPGQPYALGVLASSGITRPAELAGKVYGGFGSSVEPLVIDEMIKNDGGSGTVKPVTLSVGAYEALKAKKVDAVFAYADQVYQNEKDGIKMNLFDPQKYGLPADTGLLASANTTFLKQHPDVVRKVVKALQEGYSAAISDPDGGAAALVKAFPGKVDPGLAKYVGELQAKTLLPNPSGPIGTFDERSWQTMADWLAKNKQLVDSAGKPLTSFKVSTFLTNEYLPKG